MLFGFTAVFLFVTTAIFADTFKSSVPVTLTSERSGIIMETNAKVKMRGVEVGRVGQVGTAKDGARLTLEIDPDQIQYIPANVEAEIDVTTAFGAKFVDLVYPENPSKERLAAGAVLRSKNVSTEVNTVFENVVDLIEMIDPAKLNAVLTAVADAVRGQGERMGQATTDLNQVLTALNDRSEIIREDWRSFKNFNDTYAEAAQDILTVLDAASTTSQTVVNHSSSLDTLLLNAIGFGEAGSNLLVSSKDNLVAAADVLEPTTGLLLKYSPTYTCLLQGAHFNLENGGYEVFGGRDGRTLNFDVALLLGNDPYSYPEQSADRRGQGGTGRQAGLWVAARRCEELPGAPAHHQHRVGYRSGRSAQPGHRAPLLRQLAAGDTCRAGAAEHPPVHSRAGDRAGALSGSAAVRRTDVRARRGTAVAGGAAGAARSGSGKPRVERPDAAVTADERPKQEVQPWAT